MEDNPKGVFSQTTDDVHQIGDIRAYNHCKYETIGNSNILSNLKDIYNEDRNYKEEFKHLETLNIVQVMVFEEFDELEWVKIVLSRIHDQFYQLVNQLVEITK